MHFFKKKILLKDWNLEANRSLKMKSIFSSLIIYASISINTSIYKKTSFLAKSRFFRRKTEFLKENTILRKNNNYFRFSLHFQIKYLKYPFVSFPGILELRNDQIKSILLMFGHPVGSPILNILATFPWFFSILYNA